MDGEHADGGTVGLRIGTATVHALCDGAGDFFQPLSEAFPGAGPAARRAAAARDPGAFPSGERWRLHFHAFLVRLGGGTTVLVDAGIGPADAPAAGWTPAPGHLPGHLAALGVAPADVDVVLLTHLHSDHVGWSVAGARPFFPQARYVVPRADHDDVARLNPRIGDEILAPLASSGQLDVVEGSVVLAPGLRTVPTPGHTPGHTSALLESGDDAMVFSGDAVLNMLHLVDPGLAYLHDDDPDAARAARLALLRQARERSAWLATSHLTEPFAGHRALPAVP